MGDQPEDKGDEFGPEEFDRPDSERFEEPHEEFGSSRNDFGPDKFGPPRDKFAPPPDEDFGDSQDDFDAPHREFGGPPRQQQQSPYVWRGPHRPPGPRGPWRGGRPPMRGGLGPPSQFEHRPESPWMPPDGARGGGAHRGGWGGPHGPHPDWQPPPEKRWRGPDDGRPNGEPPSEDQDERDPGALDASEEPQPPPGFGEPKDEGDKPKSDPKPDPPPTDVRPLDSKGAAEAAPASKVTKEEPADKVEDAKEPPRGPPSKERSPEVDDSFAEDNWDGFDESGPWPPKDEEGPFGRPWGPGPPRGMPMPMRRPPRGFPVHRPPRGFPLGMEPGPRGPMRGGPAPRGPPPMEWDVRKPFPPDWARGRRPPPPGWGPPRSPHRPPGPPDWERPPRFPGGPPGGDWDHWPPPWPEEPRGPLPEPSWEPEVIDYGHRPADVSLGGAKFESFDYGHGRTEENKPERKVLDYGHGVTQSSRPPLRPPHLDELHGRGSPLRPSGASPRSKEASPPVLAGPKVVPVEELLELPGRESRPPLLCVLIRGPPGSGKSHLARLLKEKEAQAAGGVPPRVLCLDDYFMQEVEVNDVDPDTGKKVKRKEFRYEYEAEMEEAYCGSLLKSFRKTVDGRLFPFLLVDAVLAHTRLLEQFAGYAKTQGFQVYVAQPECMDAEECHKRNVHSRSLKDITRIIKSWEATPKHYPILDVKSLLAELSPTGNGTGEAAAEDIPPPEDAPKEENEDEDEDVHKPSRWELMDGGAASTGERLLRLDGLSSQRLKHTSLDDYLQLPDDYEERQSQPGKKRVRWADIEEGKQQKRMRDIGFVVGQTDWSKFTDPSQAEKALTRTKYI